MPTPEPAPTRASTALLRDEVDRLAEAWQRERPDLDVSPLQVLSRVTRLARHLDKHRGAAFAGLGPGVRGSSMCWPPCAAPGRGTVSPPVSC